MLELINKIQTFVYKDGKEFYILKDEDPLIIGKCQVVSGPVRIQQASFSKQQSVNIPQMNVSIVSESNIYDDQYELVQVYNRELALSTQPIEQNLSDLISTVYIDLLSMYQQLKQFPIIPIYSKKLQNFLGLEDADSVMVAINSVGIAYLDNGAVQLTVSFLPMSLNQQDINEYESTEYNVSYVYDDGEDTVVPQFYISKKIDKKIKEVRDTLLQEGLASEDSNISVDYKNITLEIDYSFIRDFALSVLDILIFKLTDEHKKHTIDEVKQFLTQNRESIQFLNSSDVDEIINNLERLEEIENSFESVKLELNSEVSAIRGFALGYNNYLVNLNNNSSIFPFRQYLGSESENGQISVSIGNNLLNPQYTPDPQQVHDMVQQLQSLKRIQQKIYNELRGVIPLQPLKIKGFPNLFGISVVYINNIDIQSTDEPNSFVASIPFYKCSDLKRIEKLAKIDMDFNSVLNNIVTKQIESLDNFGIKKYIDIFDSVTDKNLIESLKKQINNYIKKPMQYDTDNTGYNSILDKVVDQVQKYQIVNIKIPQIITLHQQLQSQLGHNLRDQTMKYFNKHIQYTKDELEGSVNVIVEFGGKRIQMTPQQAESLNLRYIDLIRDHIVFPNTRANNDVKALFDKKTKDKLHTAITSGSFQNIYDQLQYVINDLDNEQTKFDHHFYVYLNHSENITGVQNFNEYNSSDPFSNIANYSKLKEVINSPLVGTLYKNLMQDSNIKTQIEQQSVSYIQNIYELAKTFQKQKTIEQVKNQMNNVIKENIGINYGPQLDTMNSYEPFYQAVRIILTQQINSVVAKLIAKNNINAVKDILNDIEDITMNILNIINPIYHAKNILERLSNVILELEYSEPKKLKRDISSLLEDGLKTIEIGAFKNDLKDKIYKQLEYSYPEHIQKYYQHLFNYAIERIENRYDKNGVELKPTDFYNNKTKGEKNRYEMYDTMIKGLNYYQYQYLNQYKNDPTLQFDVLRFKSNFVEGLGKTVETLLSLKIQADTILGNLSIQNLIKIVEEVQDFDIFDKYQANIPDYYVLEKYQIKSDAIQFLNESIIKATNFMREKTINANQYHENLYALQSLLSSSVQFNKSDSQQKVIQEIIDNEFKNRLDKEKVQEQRTILNQDVYEISNANFLVENSSKTYNVLPQNQLGEKDNINDESQMQKKINDIYPKYTDEGNYITNREIASSVLQFIENIDNPSSDEFYQSEVLQNYYSRDVIKNVVQLNNIFLSSYLQSELMDYEELIYKIMPRTYIRFIVRTGESTTMLPSYKQYQYQQIASVEVTREKQNPVDTQIIRIPSFSYLFNVEQSLQFAAFQEYDIQLNFLLVPGAEIEVYMGYGKDYREFKKVFQGYISQIDESDAVITLVCSGYGQLLTRPVYKRQERMSGILNDPRQLILDQMKKLGSEVFGFQEISMSILNNIRNRVDKISTTRIDKLFLQYYRYMPGTENIYMPSKYFTRPFDYNFGNFIGNFETNFMVYTAQAKYQPWDVIKDACSMIPDYIQQVEPIEDVSQQVRLFYGEQLWPFRYRYYRSRITRDQEQTQILSEIQEIQSRLNDLQNEIRHHLFDFLPLDVYQQNLIMVYTGIYNPGQLPSFEQDQLTAIIKFLSSVIWKYIFEKNRITKVVNDIPNSYVTDNINVRKNLVNLILAEQKMKGKNISEQQAKELVNDIANSVSKEQIVEQINKLENIMNYMEKINGYSFDKSSYNNIIKETFDEIIYNQFMTDEQKKLLKNKNDKNKFFKYIRDIYGPSMYEKPNGLITMDYNSFQDIIEIAQDPNQYYKDYQLPFIYAFLKQIEDIIDTPDEEINPTTVELIKKDISMKPPFFQDNSVLMSIETVNTFKNLLSPNGIIQKLDTILSNIEEIDEILNSESSKRNVSQFDAAQEYMLEQLDPNKLRTIGGFFNMKQRRNLLNGLSEKLYLPGMYPYQNMHIISDDRIIQNNIVLNDEINNTVLVRQQTVMSSWGPIGRFFEWLFKLVDLTGGFDYEKKDGKHFVNVEIMFDEDIPNEYKRTAVVESDFATVPQLRTLVGTSYLIWNMQEMYQGEMIITGSQNIKPYDFLIIIDTKRHMYGLCQAKKVTHVYSPENGFVTILEIMPFIKARDLHQKVFLYMLYKLATVTAGALITTYQLGLNKLGTSNITKYISKEGLENLVKSLKVSGISKETYRSLKKVANTQLKNTQLIKGAKILRNVILTKSIQSLLKADSLVSQQLMSISGDYYRYDKHPQLQIDKVVNPIDIFPLIVRDKPFVAGIRGQRFDQYTVQIRRKESLKEFGKTVIDAYEGIGLMFKNLGDLILRLGE